jgi:hypothetical protein
MAYEFNGVVYDTASEKLARTLEAIRQRQKEPNPFRIKVEWVSKEIRPYEGYIVLTHPKHTTEYDSAVSFPILAWKSNSTRGKHLDPSLISRISYASASMRAKATAEYLYLRDYQNQDEYFARDCTEFISAAVFMK